MNILRLNSSDADFWNKLDKRLAWDSSSDKAIFDTVNSILADVKDHGDSAVIEYTNKFDRMSVSSMAKLEIPAERLQQALNTITAEQRIALEKAAARIKSYAKHQTMES
ncbi:MAG: histidinol dehydrogenase, partial [Cocleimonas sp.]